MSTSAISTARQGGIAVVFFVLVLGTGAWGSTLHARPHHNAMLAMAAHWPVVPSRFDLTLTEFIEEVRAALDSQPLQLRTIKALFPPKDQPAWDDLPQPSCQGYWLEFGVFSGESINAAADYRLRHCASMHPIVGFDTFKGLPESWRPGFESGKFSLDGKLPAVSKNVRLVQGLFNETLEPFINTMPRGSVVTYLNIDCDLYEGSVHALRKLDRFLKPWSIINFDELINYPGWMDHEVKALYDWTIEYKRRVYVVGAAADPALSGKVVDPSPTASRDYNFQGAVVVVANQPEN